MRDLLLVVVVVAGSGCAQLMGPAKQDPFPVMQITATQPPPGPDKVILTPSNIAIIDNPGLRVCVISELAKLELDKPPGQRINVDSVPIKFEWATK